ncbi:MAG: hypothetical protein HYR94_07170 [Chloroflexi bacterium]|nr:hypothetical protein [Chloroflexota bacterium]
MKTLLYLVVLVGVLIVLLEMFYGWPVSAQTPNKPTPTSQLPIVGEPVSPGVSQGVQNLPTVTPRPPGVPAPEVNPRQRPNLEPGGTAGQSQATRAAPSCQH